MMLSNEAPATDGAAVRRCTRPALQVLASLLSRRPDIVRRHAADGERPPPGAVRPRPTSHIRG